jgi:hypothetical protein
MTREEYILIFLLIFVIVNNVTFVKQNFINMNTNLFIKIIVSLIIFGIVYAIMESQAVKAKAEEEVNPDGNSQNLNENFHFELTPEKKCDLGPYMYTSDPARQALCSQFSAADLSRYECGPGYIGRPIWRGGAGNGTLSNANWKNESCNQIDDSVRDPQVL